MSRAGSSEFPRLQPLLLLAVVVLILYFARELLIPLAFALTLAFLLAPAVTRLEALRAPRVVAVALTGILAFAAVFGVGYVVTRQLMSVARNLPAYRLNIQKRTAAVHSPAEQSLETALIAVEGIGEDLTISARPQSPKSSDTLLQFPAEQAQPVRLVDPTRSQLQSNAELLFRVLRPIGTLGVIIVFTIYLLMKREDLRHRILLLAGMGRISVMTQALQDAATRISQYLVMQATVNAAYGILFGSGLYLIGVPDATLWGALAGILRIVPYIGTATGLVLPLVVSVAIFSSWWHPLLIIALFLTLELSATNFVEPWLYSSRTGISSLALLTMAIFWALLWGWPGLILSTPLTVCIVVLGRYVPQMSFLHTLLGTDAELSPEAHFYERLLALDQHEARVVANKFLCGKPLVELYDEVFIPALRLVEQDRHQGTLDETRCNFFFLSIGELIAELTDYRQIDPLALSPNQIPTVRPTSPGAPQPALSSPRGPDSRTWGTIDPTLSHNLSPEALKTKLLPTAQPTAQNDFAIICISASDQADELTSHMLAQLMERAGHPTLLLSAASVSSEVLDGLAKEPNTVIFISALPPFAFSQARATCQRVRSHLPQNRIVIGFWEATDDPSQISSMISGLTAEQPSDHMIERFGTGRPTLVVNTLTQALNQIQQWHQQPSTQPVLQ
jgi:predicted PurR-regulated permease PerM